MMTVTGRAKHWWESLPEDFYRQGRGTGLDAEHPLELRATAACDHALRSGLGTVLCAAAVAGLSARRLRRDTERLRFYERLAEVGDSALSFPRPPHTEVEATQSRRLGSHPSRIPHRLLRVKAPFQPLNPELRASYGRHQRNATCYAQHWYHPDGPRPTLIMVHGFILDPYWFNARMFALRWFYRHGYDVLLYTLPFHGYRAAPTDWFSGHGLFAHGMAHFNEGIAHAVRDLRVLMDHLEGEGVRHMGISGFSLGGYTSALMAGVDERLAFCVPNSPLASPVDLMREWQPTGSLMKLYMRLYGVDIHELRASVAVTAPLSYAPKIDPQRILILSGTGDRLAPPSHPRLLHAHWPDSTLRWFSGNHLLHLRQGEYLREMKRFMDKHTAPGA